MAGIVVLLAPCAQANDRVAALVAALTLDEKLRMLCGFMAIGAKPAGAVGSAGFVPGVKRLGIPALQETDASLGITNPSNVRPGDTAVALPSSVAVAASFDTDIAYADGAMLGRDAAARGLNVVLGGGVNLARDPRGGRNFEYAGEDPLLAGSIVGAAVRGTGDQHVISTIKHFAVNDQESQRNSLNVSMPWAALRESDLLALQIAIEQGHPGAVMCAYNQVNGVYACENPALLNDILKHDFAYPGFVMSDWGAVHGVAALAAGLDQESAAELDAQPFFAAPLRAALHDGAVPQSRIDDAVSRMLRAMLAAGLLDRHAAPAPRVAEDLATARRAASAGIVLLRNNNMLPLAPWIKNLLVVGGQADAGVQAGGGSSQVTPVGGYAREIPLGAGPGLSFFRVSAFDPPAPLAELQARLPGVRVTWVDGRYPSQAALLARRADAAIVFVTQWSGESSDLPDLDLPDGQNGLIDAVAAVNAHTIVVLETAGPVLMPWRDRVGAIVEAWYSGSGGAAAVADVLSGVVNPSGRLPVTFPAAVADLPNVDVAGMYQPEGSAVDVTYREGSDVGYRWFAHTGRKPLYPFGYGLSYSRFALGGLRVEGGRGLVVSFDVTNIGARAGVDTPQVYVTSRAGRNGRRLVGWGRCALAPGGACHVRVAADARLLADFDAGWRVPAGIYNVAVGESAEDAELIGKATIKQ